MSDLLHVLAAAALWTAVIVRMELVLCSGTQRSHWLALAMLACAQTLQISAVYQAVETAMGVPGGASVLKHVFAVLAAAGVRSLLAGILDQPIRHRLTTAVVTAGTLLVMVVPFLLEPPRGPARRTCWTG